MSDSPDGGQPTVPLPAIVRLVAERQPSYLHQPCLRRDQNRYQEQRRVTPP